MPGDQTEFSEKGNQTSFLKQYELYIQQQQGAALIFYGLTKMYVPLEFWELSTADCWKERKWGVSLSTHINVLNSDSGTMKKHWNE